MMQVICMSTSLPYLSNTNVDSDQMIPRYVNATTSQRETLQMRSKMAHAKVLAMLKHVRRQALDVEVVCHWYKRYSTRPRPQWDKRSRTICAHTLKTQEPTSLTLLW